MNKLFNLATLLSLFTITNLCADTCAICYPSNCCIEFNALFLQPSGSNLHYVAEAEPLPLPSPNWKIRDIRPDYHLGFEVGLCALFHDKNTKAVLNYSHFHSKDSDSTEVSSTDMLGPFFEIGPDAQPYKEAKGSVSFDYDAINGDYGLVVCFCEDMSMYYFGGIGFVRLEQDLLFQYANTEHTVTRKIKTPSSFTGAGPQLGVDVAYNLCNHLHLTGGGMTTLYVGHLKNHTTYKSTTPLLEGLGITPPNKQSTHVQQRTQIIPSLEGRLGLAYCINLCNCTINLDAGYEVRYYFNALQSVDMGSEVEDVGPEPAPVGVYARTFQRNISDFALAGPYLKVNIGF